MRPAICTPRGRPCGPVPAGTVTHGPCSRVQSALKAGSPVQPIPAGASPAAEAVITASKPSMAPGKAARALACVALQESNCAVGKRFAQSSFSLIVSESCARAAANSQPKDCTLSIFVTYSWASKASVITSGSVISTTSAPALRQAAMARSISASVSGAALAAGGPRVKARRGARGSLASGLP